MSHVTWIQGPDGGAADESAWETMDASHASRQVPACAQPRGAEHRDSVVAGWLHVIDGCPACAAGAATIRGPTNRPSISIPATGSSSASPRASSSASPRASSKTPVASAPASFSAVPRAPSSASPRGSSPLASAGVVPRSAIALISRVDAEARSGCSELWSGTLGPERTRVAVRVFADAGAVKTSALLAEASALCCVAHPNVVRVLAAALDDARGSSLLLVRQWTDGTLSSALDSIGVPARIIALLQTALGLAALHEHPAGPFIAGCVSASAIAVGSGGVARVVDWGMTRVVRAVERVGGADSGSRALWRAPELFARRGTGATLSGATDVYSFAITCFEVLTGLEPYADVDAAPAELISRIAAGTNPLRPSLTEMPTSVPAHLVSAIESAWASDPAARPTMRELVHELKAACNELGVGQRADAALRDDERARASSAAPSAGARGKMSSALTLYVDDDDLPSNFSAAVAFTAAAAPVEKEPRVVLAPFWNKDPPLWEPSFDGAGFTPIPQDLNSTLLPLPARAASACVAAVVVPFYTEGGFALRRTLEALALQAADLRALHNGSSASGPPPELHVFAIADGWTKPNGDPILSQSAFTELLDVFGPTLDVDALIDLLEGPAEKPDGDDSAELPEHVFVQFAAPTGRDGTLELRPVVLDCSWALGMHARAGAPEGAVVRELRERRRRKTGGGGGKRRLHFKKESSPLLDDAESVNVRAASGGEDEGLHGDMQPLYFTLMIKRRNGKKHHSLRWFFEALAPVTRMRGSDRFEYMFATDCGTLYAPHCIGELITHLQSNENCAAVTAHQRIMSKVDQLDPLGAEPDTFVGNWLRNVQGYDFESGLCVFNGMHGLAGFLPVVPGPCGLFRASAITNGILRSVRKICHSTPEDGLILSNLLLAEDRILSYLLVLVATPVSGEIFARTWETHWVPSSVFFFESEGTLKELVLQRRRWLNGTLAGYVWLLQQPPLWRGVCAMRGTAWNVLLLSTMQLLVFGIVFIWPGMLILTGTLAISGLGVLLSLCGVPLAYWSTFEIFYISAAVGSFIAHVYFARLGGTPFTEWIWTFRALLNAFTMVVLAFVTLMMICISSLAPGKFIDVLMAGKDPSYLPTAQQDVQDTRLAGVLGLLYTATPFLLASMHSNESLVNMLAWFPRYYLFQPTILADFFSYSIARFDDLSWGTKSVTSTVRAGGSGEAERAAARVSSRRAARSDSSQSPSARSASSRSRRSELAAAVRATSAREASSTAATMLSILQVSLALVIAVLNYALKLQFTRYLFFLGGALSAIGFVIMLLSVLYFTKSAIFGLNSSIAHRCRTIFSLCCWLTMCSAIGLLAFYQTKTFLNQSLGGITFLCGLGLFSAFAVVSFATTPATGSQ